MKGGEGRGEGEKQRTLSPWSGRSIRQDPGTERAVPGVAFQPEKGKGLFLRRQTKADIYEIS